MVTEDGSSLSGGEAQRLALARVLVNHGTPADPATHDLLILDEPNAGLDPLVQHEFHTLLREAVDAGAAVFLSSHTLSEVQRVADRVGIIRNGRLIATESVAALRAKTVFM